MRIVIFHFNPIEKFPPVMNVIQVLENKLPVKAEVIVFTTNNEENSQSYKSLNNQIKIKRLGSQLKNATPVLRFFNYAKYFLGSLIYCLFHKPHKIFYYESMSALIPCILKAYFFKHTQLYIHYHEYMSGEDYNNMYLSKVFHKLEKKIYKKAVWISQTNQDRMSFFLEDIALPELANTHIFPNYPLAKWGINKVDYKIKIPVKLIYVGSFGCMETIYVKETLQWVVASNGLLVLDIYSYNIPEKITTYINNLNCEYINVLEQVDYYNLPITLNKYDVGLILYKGTSKNFEFNAPNKLFEYLSCELDVWYPETMKGIWQYDSSIQWPKVIRLNFDNLGQYSINALIEKDLKNKRQINLTCENASKNLINKLISNN